MLTPRLAIEARAFAAPLLREIAASDRGRGRDPPLEQPKNAITFRERAVELARRSADAEARRILLEDAIAAAERLDRADLAAAWRSEHAALSSSR